MSQPEDTWHEVEAAAAELANTVGERLRAGTDVILGINLVGEHLVEATALRIGASQGRFFAFLVRNGNYEGVYFRSVDPHITDDPRFFACVGYGDRPTNWVRLLPSGELLPDGQLRALVVESHRLTLMRNQGVPPKSAYGDVHPILIKALDAAPEDERTPPPYHAGGPRPQLPGPEMVGVAIACGEHVMKLAPEAQRDELTRVLVLAQKARELERARKATRAEIDGRELEKAAAARPKDSPALRVARRAAACAQWLTGDRLELVMQNAGLTAERAVDVLHAQGEPGSVRDLLNRLDEWILRAELLAVDPGLGGKAQGHDVKSLGVTRVLWRAANDKGYASTWLVRFDDSTYGLRRKVGSRFRWILGSRDDVVASVPDATFEGAVAHVLERDNPSWESATHRV
jgi:hypothetical protein